MSLLRLSYRSVAWCLAVAGLLCFMGASDSIRRKPTFYRDVLPILQQHCQSCHRPGEIAPMPLVTYDQALNYAQDIKSTVVSKTMPPWFADRRYGKFVNDPSLTPQQIDTISRWVDAHAPAGNPADAPPPPHWSEGWNISTPDLVLRMPQPVSLPARGMVDYTY